METLLFTVLIVCAVYFYTLAVVRLVKLIDPIPVWEQRTRVDNFDEI